MPVRLLLVAALVFTLEAQAQTASFELLPSEIDGIHAVSPNGRALVLSERDGSQTAFSVWSGGTITPFSPPECGDGYASVVLAVSDDGVPKGFQRGISPTSWVWDGADCRAATGVGGAVVFLSAVTPDGGHAAGYLNFGGPDTNGGYIWNDGVGTFLPPPGGDSNRALRLDLISDDGSTSAGYEIPDRSIWQPILVQNGSKVHVPTPLGRGTVNDLSADGTIALVLDLSFTGMVGDAFLFENGGVTIVPPFPGAQRGWPQVMSGDGTRLVGSVQFGTDATVRDAVVWDGLAPRLLRDLLVENGIDPASIPSNLHVEDLSTDGRVIIGRYQDGPSIRGLWRAVLPATAAWAGDPSGFWDEPDRWTPAAVPDSLVATVIVATDTGHTLTLRRDEATASLAVVADVTATSLPPVVLDLNDHTLTLGPAEDALIVGAADSAYLALEGGGLVVDGSVVLGRLGEAQGILTVDGGHALTIEGGLTVADGGTDPTGSAVLVSDGSVTTTAGMILGAGPETSGLLSLSPGTRYQNTVQATSSVGSEGEGVMTLDGAFASHTGPLVLGAFEAGQGRIDLANTSSMLTTDSLFVGLRGAGELRVASGSGLSTGPAVLGDREGSVGSVVLTGAGSRWDVVGDLVVGDQGAAVLEVKDQAFICLGGASHVGPQGRVVLDGTVRIELVTNCAALSREARSAASSGLLAAALTVDAGGELVAQAVEVGAGGVVDGAGALSVPVTNGGTLAPGGDGALGTLALTAPLTQTADGTLSVEIGASSTDVVTVDGAVTLGGTLRLAALPSEAPTVGQSYEVLTASSIAGAFDRIEAPEGLVASVSATAVTVTVASAVDAETRPASSLLLHAPSPNPSRGVVELAFELAEAGPVRLSVHDALGREVAVPVDGLRQPGAHEVRLDTGALATGVYVVRLVAGREGQVQRLTVVR